MWTKINTLLASTLTFIAFTHTSAALADHLDYSFKPYKAVYQVKAKGFNVGKANFEFIVDENDTWQYNSHAKPSGMAAMLTSAEVFESSRFKIEDNRVIPLGSEYKRTGKKAEESTAVYDWDNMVADFTYNGETQQVALTNDHQDRSTIVPALIWDVVNGRSEATHPIIDKRMKTRSHAVQSPTTLKLPKHGKVDVVELKQTDKSKRTIHAWLAPSMNYLPVRIEQFRKGKSQVRMTLLSVEWLTPPKNNAKSEKEDDVKDD